MVLNQQSRSQPLGTRTFLELGAAGFALMAVLLLVQRAMPAVDSRTLVVLKLLLIAPIIEEGFFRGVVHAGLRGRTDTLGRPVVANVITALAFGAAHLWFAPWIHAVAVMLPALVMGWVYERSRSVAACVVVHGLCNVFWLIWRY